jgi:hypothetical protein
MRFGSCADVITLKDLKPSARGTRPRMSQGERVELSRSQLEHSTFNVKQAFSSLVDAMRFAQRFGQVSGKVIEIEQLGRKRSEALDKLSLGIADLISSSKEVLGEENTVDLSKQIVSFSSLAIEQAKKKVAEQSANEHKELLEEEESERTKTNKSIEAFLATSPFNIHDKVITVRLTEGAYDAKCLYRCEEDIQYEFALDSKRSFDFKKEFRLSEFKGELKIPVNLGKSWIKKQPVAGYERLDNYVLSSVEASEGNLIATFVHPQRETTIRIVYSKGGSRSSLEIEYTEMNHKVSITSEPSLNKFLDSDAISAELEQLWISLHDLENYKSGLAKVIQHDQNLVQSNAYPEFFASSWKVMAPKVSTMINRGDPDFDEAFVRQKIGSLGENGMTILSIIGLSAA